MVDTRVLRIVAAVALVAGATLFGFGVARERSGAGVHEAAVAESGHAGETDETGGGEGSGGGERTHAESDAELLGIDLESPPFVVVAVIVSVGLAAGLVGLRSRTVVLVTLVVALAFAIADVREILVQLDEERKAIALIAALVALLHVTASIAAFAAWRRVRVAQPSI